MLGGWLPSSPPPSKPKAKPTTRREEWLAFYEEQTVESRILWTLVAGSVAGSLATLGFVRFHNRFLRRFPTHEWLTPDLYEKKRWIKGIVTSVGDPDGFRLYHTPVSAIFWKRKVKSSSPKYLKTISVRLAGIDAPEYGHFNKESQPFSQEALDWLKKMVLGKVAYCQLLKRDQYGRAVAAVMLPGRYAKGFLAPRHGTPLADEMLRAGLAVTYTDGGAVYGPGGLEGHLAIEAKAKKQRRGQWANGTNIETPSEYKRRHRTASDAEVEAEQTPEDKLTASEKRNKRSPRGILQRLFGA